MNFGDIPDEYCKLEDSKIIVLPVSYDKTSTWIKGAGKGPKAILNASANMELYDIETGSEVYKRGIFTDKQISGELTPEEMVSVVGNRVKDHLKKDKFIVLIGGEHSVSIGAIKAHSEKFKEMSVLQLDAHSDLRQEYHDSRFNHACVMARAKEGCKIVQVGIRSMDKSELNDMDKGTIFFAEDIQNNKTWVSDVVKLLSKNVYITIDLDVFDPAIMPSTGTPEPGGLWWYEVLNLLKQVIKNKNVIGCDVVELCPNENDKAPDFLAAKLIYKILSYKYEGVKK
ncbi:MAG: agmatinase [Nanoarchaeota archaeon]|nr:agmatinase [Nanoarchaeota archaeon]